LTHFAKNSAVTEELSVCIAGYRLHIRSCLLVHVPCSELLTFQKLAFSARLIWKRTDIVLGHAE